MDSTLLARRRLLFFFLAVRLSWPLSDSLSVFDPLLDELLDDDDELLELLELSDAKPVLSFTLTEAANLASSGSLSLRTRNHLRDSFGRPGPFCAKQWENLFCCKSSG